MTHSHQSGSTPHAAARTRCRYYEPTRRAARGTRSRPRGERSIARAYIKAFGRARRLIYLEDQYLWSFHATRVLCDALRREPELLLVIVIPRYPDPGGRMAGAASILGRERVQDALYTAGGDRVAIYDLENEEGTPVYVPASATVPANSLATTRLRLSSEHTGGVGLVTGMIDPQDWFDTLRRSAETLDDWHRGGRLGRRPPGHLRAHPIERANAAQHGLLHWVHAHVLDPDGRPSHLKRRDTF